MSEGQSKNTINTVLCMAIAVLVLFSGFILAQNVKLKGQNVWLKRDLARIIEVEDQDAEMGRFVLTLMDQTNTNYSPAKKQIIVQTIVRVTKNIFTTKEQRQNFAVLLAIESKFNRAARSSAGAIGVAQVMPKFAREFARACGIKDYIRSDLDDLELNMTIGACQFRALLESKKIGGNIAAALVAYNAGKHSQSLRELMGLRSITNREPSNYVAKFTFLSEEIKKIVSEVNKETEKSQEKASGKVKKTSKKVVKSKKR